MTEEVKKNNKKKRKKNKKIVTEQLAAVDESSAFSETVSEPESENDVLESQSSSDYLLLRKDNPFFQMKLKSYELLIVSLVVFILGLIAFTIKETQLPLPDSVSLPQQEEPAQDFDIQDFENTENVENSATDVLGYTDIGDQYALCSTFFYFIEKPRNPQQAQENLENADNKLLALTQMNLSENSALQERISLLEVLATEELHTPYASELIQKCNTVLLDFNEIYAQQTAMDAAAFSDGN